MTHAFDVFDGILIIGLALGSTVALAESLTVTVTDETGAGLSDAVVFAEPASGHHVYSFSPAKVFDLPLYSGKTAAPQMFEKAGTVVLGCNIHDQMLAYVEVVNTPYFAKTDASGKAILENMVPGKYLLKAWHFSLPLNAPAAEQPINIAGGEGSASFKLNVKPDASAN